MTVYIIAQLSIHDPEEYEKYQAQFMDVFEHFDGSLLSVDEEPVVLEGEWTATRSVLIEFPSKSSAVAWMASDAYQAISVHRRAASVANSILVQALPEQESND